MPFLLAAMGFLLPVRPIQAQSVTNTCAQYLTINTTSTPSYYVQTNFWNEGSCPGTQCMTINNATGDFSVTAGNFGCGDTVASYPSIVYGCQTGTACSTGTNLPIEVSALTCVTSSWNIAVTNETGSDLWDAAYDIWFDESATNFTHEAELMIWLDYMPGTGPAGSLKASGIAIGNSPTTWDVYEGPIGWNYIAFLADTPTTSFNNVNILAFINYCVTQGYIQSTWYLGAIEAGIELRTGGIPFTSSGFSASVNSSSCGTATFTPAVSVTKSSTPTMTETPTCTLTPTLTPTNSFTPTQIYTPTPTPTITWTPVNTSTMTWTLTSTSTSTPTPTPTSSFTPTRTFTPTFSPTATYPPAISLTPTITSSNSSPIGGLSIFPNPVFGSGPVSIQFVLNNPAGQVNLKIFTIAFRKVKESTFQNVPAGLFQTQLNMMDDYGVPLANGLYYLVVTTPQGHVVGKIINLH